MSGKPKFTREQRDQNIDLANRMLDRMDAFQLLNALNAIPNSENFIVPMQVTTEIIELQAKYGVVRRLGRVADLTGVEKRIPVLNSLVPVVYHREFGKPANIANIETPITRGVDLYPHVDFVEVALTSDLEEDARGLLGRLKEAAAVALGAKEDRNCFTGNETQATGYTLGICNALKASSLHVTTAESVDALTLDDFLKTLALLPEYASEKPRWFMSREFHALACLRILGAAGAALAPPDDADAWFLGHKVHFIPGMPGANAFSGDVPAVLGHLELAAALGFDRGLMYQTYVDDERDLIVMRLKQITDFRIWDRGSDEAGFPPGSLVGLQLSGTNFRPAGYLDQVNP